MLISSESAATGPIASTNTMASATASASVMASSSTSASARAIDIQDREGSPPHPLNNYYPGAHSALEIEREIAYSSLIYCPALHILLNQGFQTESPNRIEMKNNKPN